MSSNLGAIYANRHKIKSRNEMFPMFGDDNIMASSNSRATEKQKITVE